MTKTFGDHSDQRSRAPNDVALTIEPGEFISVDGPSGCGNSTLMLMVAGVLGRTTGAIAVDGNMVSKPITDVGIAFQDYLLLDFRTAIDNVMLQVTIRGLSRKDLRAKADGLFDRLRLSQANDFYT